jgi:hypothetical protein
MRRRAFHEAHRRNERVEHAWILSNTCCATELLVEAIRILARKIVRVLDPDRPQIPGERRSDVGNRLEPLDRAIVGRL